MQKFFLLQLITFLAAFLLFQIELIVAKLILPHYGGSYLVWGACVVFFQAFLVLGYWYSHVVGKKISIAYVTRYHLILLLIPLLSFPGRPLVIEPTQPSWPLAMGVFWELFRTIGLVFFVLSTISIITQNWLAASQLPQRFNPYSLYAYSNFGSLAALLSYPFLFEYFFNLDVQLKFWRWGYFLLIAIYAVACGVIQGQRQDKVTADKRRAIPGVDILRWLLLGAAGVMLFLAVTNMITLEIAPIPLFWVITLSIYLVTFILNFKEKSWCPAWISKKVHLLLGLSVLLFFFFLSTYTPHPY